MRIALGTIEISDDQRRAIAAQAGEQGLADRPTCRAFLVASAFGGLIRAEDAWRELHCPPPSTDAPWRRRRRP